MLITSEEISRYSQQLKLQDIGLEGQAKLKNASVLCVGAGGLGSSLLLYLAAAGVGTIGIVDDDYIELSNLQRQVLYQTEHVGKRKAIIAKQQLIALNPNLNIHAYPERLHLKNAEILINQYDIVADCSDNFSTRYLINDMCFYLSKPYVFASISQHKGQCSFFSAEEGPCFRCLFPSIPEEEMIANCNEGGVLGVLPGLMGIIQATEIMKWILKNGKTMLGELLVVDILKMDFQKFHLSKNTECPTCFFHKPPESFLFSENRSEWDKYAISAKEFQFKIKTEKDILLIDVRSKEEHDQFNLGGTLIPLPELLMRLTRLDSEKLIIVYCETGKRSIQAVKILLDKNFKSIKFLRGGLASIRAISALG